ncbi:formin [Etheostoma spectabile]|uniref:formin n=1 Tax=Etheostoma spectabile TaxID=54343 RepID=UPI0013AECF4E|nr:formin-like [Etheostoma spectabile]
MEEQKVTLKFFKTLSEEENEDIMQEDEERSQSFNVKKHGNMTFEDGVENSRDSLSHVILPNEGEKLTSNSIEHITRREAGSDSDMIDNERNNVNLTEQQSVAVNAENGLEKQSSATNQVQNKMPDGHCDKDNSCSKKGCHISENLLDECALEETLQPNTGWDCVAPVSLKQDDNEEVDQRGTKDYKKVHFREDVTSVSSPDVGFDPEESAKSQSKTKHVEPIVTVEQTGGPSCFTDDNEEERAGAEEDSEEEKRDAFPDFSAQLHHPSSPKDTSNICITSAGNSPPPEGTFTRATFTPGSPTDKPLPALFSGLRVLRKGVVGPEHDTVAQIKPSSQGARRELYPERQGDVKVQKSFLDQISNLLNTEKRGDEKEEREGMDAEGDQDENEIEEGQEDERTDLETKEDAESTKPSLSSAEAAFDAFKAFFTPKPLKKDPAEKVDLEAVRKKIRADKDVLKALFERSSKKTPEKKDSADGKSEASTSGEGEERTPGRLQAVWPPLKEEKVGLKYTEAEHQAALLQLKRECKEEWKSYRSEEFGQELSRLRVENEDNVARLELTLAELQAELSQFGTRQRGECKDVAVSTGDDFLNKSFRTVCIQTDRETFVKIPEDGEGAGRAYTSPQQQKVTPKKLDLASISLSLAGQRDDTLSSPSYDPPSQTLPPPGTIQPPSEQPPAPSQTTNTDSLPLPPPPPCLSFPLNHMQPSNGLPPPPPTPPPPPPSMPGFIPPPPPPPSMPGFIPPPPPPSSMPGFIPPPPPPSSMPGFIPPPPPPPSMPGLMPLPPPPPPVGGFSFEVPPRKPTVEPSRPMKPLYWTRIQIQDKNNKTLWNILEEPDIINASEFEELFAKTTTQTKRKPLSEAYQKKAKARKIIKLLDGKRSQAVGILISSLHLEMKDIQQAVLAVDHSVVDLETIEALYENRAQPEELERIKKHYETPEEEEVKLLDKPEQFLYELSQIPDFAGRARCIIFQSAFIDGIASVQHKLNTVSSVCKALLESDGVTEVMGLVLALGNYMNGGNRTRGQADGFGLEILPKLKDVKSKDNRISLVDYVVSYYLHNVDKHSGTEKSIFPLPEPQDVFLAAQVKFDDLNRDLRQLGRDLIRCEKDVQKVCSDSPGKNLQPFKDKMEAFVLSARKEHAEASYLLMTVQKSFQDLVLYFGLKPKSGEKEVTPAHVLMLWFEFCADFKASWKRENKTIYNERLKEAQLSVKRITAEKKVETRKINPNSLKERLRQKEANMSST